MTIIARNDLEFFPGVGNTHLFPYLESWSGNAKTILTEDGIVGAISAIELDFLPTGERRVSILADGFKQDDGYGNIVPTAEVGFSGAVFLEYNVYDSEFDVWRSTSLKEYVQEIPDAILDSQYGSQYSFVQIDLPSNLLVDQEPISIDGDHRLMLVVVSSDVDLVATDLDAAITIGDYFGDCIFDKPGLRSVGFPH